MKKNAKTSKSNKTEPDKVSAESIGHMAGKILDGALCLIDKRISFASENAEILDNLIDYIEGLDKEDMSKTEKNSLIQKINDLKISKLSEITSVISMCKDKLNADETNDEEQIVFLVDYGDESDEICIKEGLNEN